MTTVPPLIVTQDNAFFFEGCREGRLLIQRCADCEALRHPPGPVCPECRSFDWDTVESSRRGTVHAFTTIHHPQDPAFDYPLTVALVDLDEGVRFVADVAGIAGEQMRSGLPVSIGFAEHAHGEVLPQVHPQEAEVAR